MGDIKKYNLPFYSVIMTEQMTKEFDKYIYSNILEDELFKTNYSLKPNTESAYIMTFNGKQAQKIVEHFYKNSNVGLDRKIKAASKVLEWKPKRKMLGHKSYSQISDLLIQGYLVREIVEELDVSLSTINKVKEIIKLPIKRRKY